MFGGIWNGFKLTSPAGESLCSLPLQSSDSSHAALSVTHCASACWSAAGMPDHFCSVWNAPSHFFPWPATLIFASAYVTSSFQKSPLTAWTDSSPPPRVVLCVALLLSVGFLIYLVLLKYTCESDQGSVRCVHRWSMLSRIAPGKQYTANRRPLHK